MTGAVLRQVYPGSVVPVLIMRKRNYLRATRRTRAARKTRVFILLGVLLAGYFLASFIFGEMGMVKYYRMKAHHADLVADTERLKQENTALIGKIRALRNDPVVIEQLARDKLGLARPGEIVYYYGQSGR